MLKVLALALMLTMASTAHAEEVACEQPSFISHIVFNGSVDSTSSALVRGKFQQAQAAGARAIVFEFSTPGGIFDDGIEISQAIERATVPVYCVVDGAASSMGFFILQSCPVRAMTLRSHLMAHEVRIENESSLTPTVVENYRDELQAYTLAYAEHSAMRMTVDTAGFLRRISGDREWWFSWKTAMKYGAVDGVVGSVKEFISNVQEFETAKKDSL